MKIVIFGSPDWSFATWVILAVIGVSLWLVLATARNASQPKKRIKDRNNVT